MRKLSSHPATFGGSQSNLAASSNNYTLALNILQGQQQEHMTPINKNFSKFIQKDQKSGGGAGGVAPTSTPQTLRRS